MPSLRKLFGIVLVLAALSFATTAQAGTPPYSLKVVPQVSFGQSISVSATYYNNTNVDANCYIYIEQTGYATASFTLYANSPGNTGFGVPNSEKNGKLTFDLVCGGNIVAKDTVNVKTPR